MRGSPIQNFICVLALLLVMAAGIVMTTRETPKVPVHQTEKRPQATNQTEVTVRMVFSHPPEKVNVQRANSTSPSEDRRPTNNQTDLLLSLPAEKVTEFLIDIQWPEPAEPKNAHYFTQIIIRQDGQEDNVIVFADTYSTFSDTFSIDTRTLQK